MGGEKKGKREKKRKEKVWLVYFHRVGKWGKNGLFWICLGAHSPMSNGNLWEAGLLEGGGCFSFFFYHTGCGYYKYSCNE